MTEPDEGNKPTPWSKFLVLLAIVADASAVVTLLAGDQSIMAMVIGALAALFGLFLLLGRDAKLDWKIVICSVASILAGLLIVAVAVMQLMQPPAAQEKPQGQQASGSPTPSVDGGVQPETLREPMFAGEVTLQAGSGVDLDQKGKATSSRTGGTDLYLDATRGMLGSGSFFPDNGDQADGYERCAGTKGRRDGYPAFIPVAIVQYCFATSDGNVGWLTVADASHAPMAGSSGYVVVSVSVWPK